MIRYESADGMGGRNMAVTPTEIVTVGGFQGARKLLSNYTQVQTFAYTCGSAADLLAVSYNMVNNWAYMTGYADAQIVGLPC